MSPHIHVQIQPGNTTEYIRADGSLGTPGGGAGVPIGSILWWSPLNGAVPSGWAECDGVANAPGPDLRDRFVVGRGTGHTVDTTGGADTHTHAGHATHTASGDHAHGTHAAHVVTQPAAHVFTQPSGHTAHVVTQPTDHTDVFNHVHVENQNSATTGSLTGWGARDTSTSTSSATSYSTANPTTGGVAAQVHSGAAVDAHSAHAGGAVDAHSGTAVDAHGAHDFVGAHTHNAHGAHNTPDSQPTWYALIAIQRMT